MEKLLVELLKYVINRYPVDCKKGQIKIGDCYFFIVLNVNGEENLTLNSFILNHYPEGKKLNLKNSYYVFTDLKSVKIIEMELWIDYQNTENKDELIFTANDRNEILVIDKPIFVKNDL